MNEEPAFGAEMGVLPAADEKSENFIEREITEESIDEDGDIIESVEDEKLATIKRHEDENKPVRPLRRFRRLTLEQKFEIKRTTKKYLAMGFSYEEMRRAFKKDGVKISVGALFRIIMQAKDDLFSSAEAWRIVSERIEKRKYVENEALSLYVAAKSSGDLAARAASLRILSETHEKGDTFISRFNLIPATPTRPTYEDKPLIPLDQLLSALVEEKPKQIEAAKTNPVVNPDEQK